MDVATVDELFARDRRDERTALVDRTGREYDAHWLCTTAWKAGNFLRHAGVREGTTVGVVGDGPLALVSFLGTTLLEGTTRFEPPSDLSSEDGFRALVAPVTVLESGTYDLPPGAQRLGYGEKPTEPAVQHFDAGLWSENPSFPPRSIDPSVAMVSDGDRLVSHETALEAARDVIDEYGLAAGDRVVVREPWPVLETVVAGVIAPLLADGVVVLADGEGVSALEDETKERAFEDGELDGSIEPPARGEYAVSSEPVPEPERIVPDSVSLDDPLF
ncbi:hypothetical protein EA462_06730 [Natrarchaeobius halalkaliphilus]|uniref:Acetyl-CoA synthetase n=1 Tax=Natrarchaeobius halalkaliphilus TaxID=1679091 RepID=A0A3N6LSU6_9EURY|nr:hypothetical protein [Natrarchaeobius halalkaliphilus]RQG91637.1 hypothetical protein EA462_06730 [Natrarchaeobius halalkaliphilus]